jgi:hypothetical protein
VKDADIVKLNYDAGTALAGTGTRRWGLSDSPLTYDPPAPGPTDLRTELGQPVRPRPGRVLSTAGAGAKAEEPAEHSRPRVDRRSELSRRVRPLHDAWLTQAGVTTEHVELAKAGISGNGHMMMIEKNSADIAKVMGQWLGKTVKPARGDTMTRAMPPKTIPTFSTETFARKGFYFAGGSYWGEKGREVMRGAMYTEVWVPKRVRQPQPVVLFAANGQTGVQWEQTPDGRPGWAYRLLENGYVVYLTDYPARGRSGYVPLPGPDGKTPIDGNFGIRTALELERIWTNARERGDFRSRRTIHNGRAREGRRSGLRCVHEKPGSIRGSVGDAGARRGHCTARCDRLPGHHVHAFDGRRIGFDITEARSQRVPLMVALEPGGPQFGGVDTAKVQPGPRNPNSWGLTTSKYEYDPPAASPADLKTVLEEKQERPDEVRCWMQQEPARKLAHWRNIRVLMASANATYHRVYDPCIPKFLKQAGVQVEFHRLEDVGIRGNSHVMMLEKNSDEIIKWIMTWLQKNSPTT